MKTFWLVSELHNYDGSGWIAHIGYGKHLMNMLATAFNADLLAAISYSCANRAYASFGYVSCDCFRLKSHPGGDFPIKLVENGLPGRSGQWIGGACLQ